jgi:outer membrane protein assembly factor BamB
MKKIKTLKQVREFLPYKNKMLASICFSKLPSPIGIRPEAIIDCENEEIIMKEQTMKFNLFSDKLFYQLEQTGDIYIFDFKKSTLFLEQQGKEIISLLYSDGKEVKSSILFGKRIDNNTLNEDYFEIKFDLSIEKTNYYYNYNNINGVDVFKIGRNNQIIYGEKDGEPLWQVDVTHTGECYNDAGELQPKNELYEPLFGSELYGYVYAPLKGGQLVAFNVTDGTLAWSSATKYSGRYAIYGDRIYKMSDCFYVIDASNGVLLHTLDIEKISPIKFAPNGQPIVFEDIIVLYGSYDGTVLLLNRETLEVMDYVKIEDGVGIPYSPICIKWHCNKLYIKDSQSRLHIYENVTNEV